MWVHSSEQRCVRVRRSSTRSPGQSGLGGLTSREIVLEWGHTHRLLDALGIGSYSKPLHVRLQRLLRQIRGGVIRQTRAKTPRGLARFGG